MPVLEATDSTMPRSVLRHRPLDDSPKHSVVTAAARPVTQRASRARPKTADDDLVSEWQRGEGRSSVNTVSPQRASISSTRDVYSGVSYKPPLSLTPSGKVSLRLYHSHPLLFLGLGMLIMLALCTLLMAGLNWGNDVMNYVHYGDPRTFQMDAVVGHNDSVNNPSHFIALNLHGRIEIIEFPGGDGAHARIFLGPQLYGTDAEKTPATLRFADVNGDHRPDVLIFFQSSWIVFINSQGSFRSPTAQERQEASQYLATHSQ